MPQPMPMPSTYPPATANIHDEMTFTVTGVFTSPTAMSAFTMTMLSARPMPRKISTSST